MTSVKIILERPSTTRVLSSDDGSNKCNKCNKYNKYNKYNDTMHRYKQVKKTNTSGMQTLEKALQNRGGGKIPPDDTPSSSPTKFGRKQAPSNPLVGQGQE